VVLVEVPEDWSKQVLVAVAVLITFFIYFQPMLVLLKL
jgi:hypothetical protein